MAGSGDLHVEEDFARAKRNLLWFCSSALLLWMVHVPPDGELSSSLVGFSTKLDVNLLRAAIWTGCLYCFVGFYRQVRNIERLNSAAVYTKNVGNLQDRLAELADHFAKLCAAVRGIFDGVSDEVEYRLDLDHARERLQAAFDEAIREAQERFGNPAGAAPAAVTERNAEDLVASAVERQSKMLRWAQYERSRSLWEIAYQHEKVVLDIQKLQRQFNRLSRQIRSDHRFFFIWYDKILSYAIFAAATAATVDCLWPAAAAGLSPGAGTALRSLMLIASVTAAFPFFVMLGEWVLRRLDRSPPLDRYD